jgi:hypothetical protein
MSSSQRAAECARKWELAKILGGKRGPEIFLAAADRMSIPHMVSNGVVVVHS